MKQGSIVIGILLCLTSVFGNQTQQDEPNTEKNPYLEWKPPVLKAEVFPLMEFILDFNKNITDFRQNLTILNHGTPFIAENGKKIYSPGVITSQNIDGKWTSPVFASFSGKFVDVNPFLSPDGKRLYFFRSFEGIGGGEEGIYVAEKQDKGWAEPQKIDPNIFSFCDGYQITESLDRTIYFGSSKGKDKRGWSDLYKSEYVDGKYKVPVNLGDAINSEKRDEDPYISPKGDYLIFLSDRPGGFGDRDLYISFRQGEGKWSKAMNMGKKINSNGADKWPMVSAGGKILLFVTGRNSGKENQFYWIDARIIEDLRPKK